MRLTIQIRDDLSASVKQEAHREGISVSAFIIEALELYLEQRRKEAGLRMLRMATPDAVAPDAHEELEKGRTETRD